MWSTVGGQSPIRSCSLLLHSAVLWPSTWKIILTAAAVVWGIIVVTRKEQMTLDEPDLDFAYALLGEIDIG